jgi:hypothetical protein
MPRRIFFRILCVVFLISLLFVTYLWLKDAEKQITALLLPLGPPPFKVTEVQKNRANLYFKSFPFLIEPSFKLLIYDRNVDPVIKDFCFSEVACFEKPWAWKMVFQDLDSEDETKRGAARSALSVYLLIKPPAAEILPALLTRWDKEIKFVPRIEIARLLRKYKNDKRVDQAFQKTEQGSQDYHNRILSTVSLYVLNRDKQNLSKITALLHSNAVMERRVSVMLLWLSLGKDSKPFLISVLNDDDSIVRKMVKDDLENIKVGKLPIL